MIEKSPQPSTALRDDPRWEAELASAAVYPETDGKPMGESSLQVKWILKLFANFECHFADRSDVVVAGDLFWYPVEGRPRICRAPDVMVIFGRPKRERMSYRQWEEGNVAPQVVIEVLSRANRPRHRQEMFQFYETYGVEEFYQFDPDLKRLEGWLRGASGRLDSIPDMNGWTSPRLQTQFDWSGGELNLWFPGGQGLLTLEDIRTERDRAEQAKREAKREKRRAKAAELRAQQAEQRAKDAAQQADVAQQQNKRLRERLRRLGVDPDQV